jgi:hypothetical protein
MAIEGFGPDEFQLVLLRRMADYRPELVEQAVRRLGSDRAQMREANRRWQAMIRSPRSAHGARRYESVLGPAEARVRRQAGDLSCAALLWPLPLWPELRFELLLGPDGSVWNEWLVRAPGTTPPVLRAVADLQPWSCVVGDVGAAFPGARPLEGNAPSRWGIAFEAPELEAPEFEAPEFEATDTEGAEGRTRSWVAAFTWGLLQEVRPADDGR